MNGQRPSLSKSRYPALQRAKRSYHRPVLAWLAAPRVAPDVLGPADLLGRFPDRPPPFPVVWVVPPDHGEPPWGKTVVAGE
jgi:hypothetical protein